MLSRRAVPEMSAASLDTLRDRAQEVASDAVEALAPRIDSAREALAPRIEAARDQAVDTVRTRVLPRVSKTISDAAAVSEPVRDEAKKRSEAAIAALRGDLPTRRRRWPRAVLLMTAGAVAGAAAGLLAGRRNAAAPGLDAYAPGGADLYARTEPTPAGGLTASPTPPTPAASPTADTTIDVTGEPVRLTSDGAARKSAPDRKPRRSQSQQSPQSPQGQQGQQGPQSPQSPQGQQGS